MSRLRNDEVARWDEISFDTATWTLPPSRMKMGREHQVPLSDAALAILRRQHDERGNNPHVFPGRPALGTLGPHYDMRPHA